MPFYHDWRHGSTSHRWQVVVFDDIPKMTQLGDRCDGPESENWGTVMCLVNLDPILVAGNSIYIHIVDSF